MMANKTRLLSVTVLLGGGITALLRLLQNRYGFDADTELPVSSPFSYLLPLFLLLLAGVLAVLVRGFPGETEDTPGEFPDYFSDRSSIPTTLLLAGVLLWVLSGVYALYAGFAITFSRIGMIYGAAFSWNPEILPEAEINRQISVLEFGDASGNLVSVLDLLSHQDAYPWRTAVMVQEAMELHKNPEEAAELLRSCSEADGDASNASIDALCAVLYEKAGTIRPENRPMIYAYLLAADGLKVLNRLLPFLRASVLSEGTLPVKADCFTLAGDLERWLYSYKELWRTVSRESELYRIAHVFCWYADLLRDQNA